MHPEGPLSCARVKVADGFSRILGNIKRWLSPVYGDGIQAREVDNADYSPAVGSLRPRAPRLVRGHDLSYGAQGDFGEAI